MSPLILVTSTCILLPMAGIRLQAPGHFDFSKPEEWPKWMKRFQQYRSASGRDAEGELRQVDTLLYCMGGEAESVLVSTNVEANTAMSWESLTPTLMLGGTQYLKEQDLIAEAKGR